MKKIILFLLAAACAFLPQTNHALVEAKDDGMEKLMISIYNYSANALNGGTSESYANEELLYANADFLDKYRVRKLLSIAENTGNGNVEASALANIKGAFDKRVKMDGAHFVNEIGEIYEKASADYPFPENTAVKYSPDKEIITSLLCDGIYEKYVFSEDGKMWIYTDNICMCFSHDGTPDCILKAPAKRSSPDSGGKIPGEGFVSYFLNSKSDGENQSAKSSDGMPSFEQRLEKLKSKIAASGIFERRGRIHCDVSDEGNGVMAAEFYTSDTSEKRMMIYMDKENGDIIKIILPDSN